MRQLSIAACMVSAVVHGLLVAQHAASEPALAAAFLTATGALVVAAALLHSGTAPAATAAGTAFVLLALVVAYAVDRTVGLPLSTAHGGAHAGRVDTLGLATKAVELVGAAAALSLLFRLRNLHHEVDRVDAGRWRLPDRAGARADAGELARPRATPSRTHVDAVGTSRFSNRAT